MADIEDPEVPPVVSPSSVKSPTPPEAVQQQAPSTPTVADAVADEASEANKQEEERAVSPPPNCAICLCPCKNKCFTDSCLHQFCFNCLLEWSKVSV